MISPSLIEILFKNKLESVLASFLFASYRARGYFVHAVDDVVSHLSDLSCFWSELLIFKYIQFVVVSDFGNIIISFNEKQNTA